MQPCTDSTRLYLTCHGAAVVLLPDLSTIRPDSLTLKEANFASGDIVQVGRWKVVGALTP